MRKIKVLVACGAGIATSTVVMKRIEDLLQDNNIEADVEQIKIAEAVSKQEGADIDNNFTDSIQNTSNYSLGIYQWSRR